MTDAGLQACRDGFTEQWMGYCEEYGYTHSTHKVNFAADIIRRFSFPET